MMKVIQMSLELGIDLMTENTHECSDSFSGNCISVIWNRPRNGYVTLMPNQSNIYVPDKHLFHAFGE